MTSRPSVRSPIAHPLWWLALAVLLVNDHLLKGSPWVPSVVTGKLSDVAGLIVAPPLLCALLRARNLRAVVLCHVAVLCVFVAIKVSPRAAQTLESALALLGVPSRIWTDATDLLALPSLWVTFRLSRDSRVMRPLLRDVGVLGALLACIATSSEDTRGGRGVPGIANQRVFPLVFQVRTLRSCGPITGDDVRSLRASDFAPAYDVGVNAREVAYVGGGCGDNMDTDAGPANGPDFMSEPFDARRLLWLKIGDAWDGIITWQSLPEPRSWAIKTEVLPEVLLVEGSKNALFVTVGAQLRTFPAPTADDSIEQPPDAGL